MRLWRAQSDRNDGVPHAFTTAVELPIAAHLEMQAVLQEYVDNSISKTINVPADIGFSDFAPLYRLAYDKGRNGCTTFRPTATRGGILTPALGCDCE